MFTGVPLSVPGTVLDHWARCFIHSFITVSLHLLGVGQSSEDKVSPYVERILV